MNREPKYKPIIQVGIAGALAEIKRQCAPGVPNQTHRNGMAASDAVIAEIRRGHGTNDAAQ
jgi:hypothetical protein